MNLRAAPVPKFIVNSSCLYCSLTTISHQSQGSSFKVILFASAGK